jgi:hypothetical protein
MRRICPHPIQWNAIYERLMKVAEERPDLPKPPIPLILNGWVFSSDAEKSARWSETVKWAEIAECSEITGSLGVEEFYCTDSPSHT